jgi:outer membrane assembly lipoprotein YfiO
MVEHNPYGPRSDEAQFRIAQYYFGKRNYREASDAYALTAAQYKDSRFYEEALFMRARAMYLSNEGPRRDPLPYVEARAGLKEYLRQFPQGEHVAESSELLVKIADVLAEKQFLIAEYYRRQKRLRAAQRYYRHVLRHYPESSWAEKAKQYLPPEEREIAPAEGSANTENRNDESH